MTQITIVDGNNWFRRRAETDVMGLPVRGCFHEIQNKDGIVIVTWDGRGALDRRRLVYPDYKVKRTPPPESMYENQRLLKKILSLGKAIQIQLDGYEADDVIAAIAERYREGKSETVFIESNDLDLYQLGLPMARNKFPEEPKNIQIYKTMVGDPSDNIPGAKGFGEKSWQSLGDFQKRTLEQIIASGWGLTDAEVEAKVKDFYPERSIKWFLDKQNRKELEIYYNIVGFIPIPWKLIESNLQAGKNKPELAEPIFQEFMI